MTRYPTRIVGIVVGFSFTLSLVGCDYWPPALQAEIEQLRSEIQTLAIEKTQLQAQATDLSKAKYELQGQLDELSRINREKTGMIISLQNQLNAVRGRALKAIASRMPTHKTPLKPTVKARSASKRVSKTSANKNQTPRAVDLRKQASILL